MSSRNIAIETPDLLWKDLYRIGGIASLLIAAGVVLAIVAYFIWPYKGNFTSMETIFATLQSDRLGGLISLDISMLLIAPLNILMFLGLPDRINKFCHLHMRWVETIIAQLLQLRFLLLMTLQ